MTTILNDGISVDAIRHRLASNTMWQHLHAFAAVPSTNITLDGLARSGAPSGTVVLAEEQTQGRMRHGRSWYSPSGVNVHVSTLHRERLSPSELPVFSLIASLAVSDAVKQLGASPAIKWPNDVLVDGRKIAGALLECAMSGSVVEFVIIGVGVNVNVDHATLHAALRASGLAAASLSEVLGHPVDRNEFTASYLNYLETWIHRFGALGAAPVLAAWRDRDILTGRRVEVRGSRGSYEGRALGVDDTGRMLVKPLLGPAKAIVDEEIRTAD